MSRQFWVITQDGQSYGPADEATLGQWVREGRLAATSTLQDATTNQQLRAGQVPGLASIFNAQQPQRQTTYQQPAGYQPQQTAVPITGYAAPQSPAAPYQAYQQPIGYQSPASPMSVPQGANDHTLGSFGPGLAIILHLLTGGLFSLIHFQLMHGRMPKLRSDDPSGGKAVGFSFIPIFNIYWIIFCFFRLCLRVEEQRAYAGLPPSDLRGALMPAVIMLFIPCVNIVGLIMFLVFLARLQGSVNELVFATRGPNA